MTHPFSTHVKPQLGRILHTLALDVEYTRAAGDYLYYQDEADQEIPVLDLLGGYGSLIFGHNNAELISHAQELLQRQIPQHAQFSLRGEAGRLAQDLNKIIQRELRCDEAYLATFANSGAEAIEAAIKHAEMDRLLKLSDLLDEITHNIEHTRTALRRGEASLSPQIYEFTGLREQVFDVRGFEDLIVGLINHNSAQLAKRPVFLLLENSFHGKLIGSVQLTYNKNFRRPFQYLGLKSRFVPMNRPDIMDRFIEDERLSLFDLRIENGAVKVVERALPIFAAFVLEPIQGEGGINPLTADFAREIRKRCNQIGCPLIIDEIQTGMGRCGTLLASSQLGLRGDYYTLSKSLGGGVSKIAVMLTRQSVYRKHFGLIHSSTFAEDDFACAIARYVLAMLERDSGAAYRKAQECGEQLKLGLEQIQHDYPDVIHSVRGKGLLIGVEFQSQANADSILLRGSAHNDSLGYMLAGYFLRSERMRVAPTGSAPNVLRLEPSLNLTEVDIRRVLDAFARVCEFLRKQDTLHLIYPLTNLREPKPRHTIEDFRQSKTTPPPTTTATTRPVRKVAFINHLISPQWLRQVDPALASFSDSALRAFVHRMAASKKTAPYPAVRITSPLGSAVDFILYPLCVDSEQMSKYLAEGQFEEIREDIEERILAAREDGCEVAGLGMYTSIVTNNCTALRVPDIALTSGNALTVAMGVEAMEKAALDRALSLNDATLVVVGAAGNIATTYCALFAQKLSRLILVGSQRDGSTRRLQHAVFHIYQDCWTQIANGDALTGLPAKLRNEPLIQHWLRDGRSATADSGRAISEFLQERYVVDPYIRVSNDIQDVARGQLILCAANSPEPFLDRSHFNRGAIVCDIAVPHNVAPEVQTERPDITYMQGGIVATPGNASLDSRARAFLQEGQMFACMAETAVLGLAGITTHYSYGPINRRQVHEIAVLARAHGFTLADFKTGSSL